jgi:c-di-GMP-binding flagellar brake protein YcgR
VELHLYLLDREEPITPLMVDIAAVRWTARQQCGLEFISLPSSDKRRLRRYVQTLQTSRLEGRV